MVVLAMGDYDGRVACGRTPGLLPNRLLHPGGIR
jgi:hypothetical protein